MEIVECVRTGAEGGYQFRLGWYTAIESAVLDRQTPQTIAATK
jgi:hypothetical protein